MDAAVPAAVLERFGAFVAQHLGANLSGARQRDLERGLLAAAHEFGFADPQACVRWLWATPPGRKRIEVLAHHLTVPETYFFRERQLFSALEEELLPPLIAARRAADHRRLRLWSAGCASGEEPYSLAILLNRMLPDWDGWEITLVATDINDRALQKGSAGVYREWSLRDAPPWLVSRYLRRTRAGRYQVQPWIRKRVVFAYHNLAEDPFPPAAAGSREIDVIVCCNVLMYLTAALRQRVVEKFHAALADGGWLLVGAAEACVIPFPDFAAVAGCHGVLRRGTPPAPAATCEPPPRPSTAAAPPAGAVPLRDPYDEALALYEQGHYAEAARVLSAPATPRAMALRARLEANSGALGEALGWCRRATAGEPLDPGLRILCAAILEELGRDGEAASALHQALYLDPQLPLAHMRLGSLLLRVGRRAEADRHLHHALELLRRHPRDEPIPGADGLTAGRLTETLLALWPKQGP